MPMQWPLGEAGDDCATYRAGDRRHNKFIPGLLTSTKLPKVYRMFIVRLESIRSLRQLDGNSHVALNQLCRRSPTQTNDPGATSLTERAW
eukprot:4923498-Pyramimonas_sp.AAC.1